MVDKRYIGMGESEGGREREREWGGIDERMKRKGKERRRKNGRKNKWAEEWIERERRQE